MSNGDEVETYHGEIGREATADAMSNGDEVETYHGEIGREATAGTQTRSTRMNLTTKKSLGQPASQNEGAGGIAYCTVAQLYQGARLACTGRPGCDLEATAPNVCMRNGESP
jgi:hypothetical protein